jgi:hypothetical protein
MFDVEEDSSVMDGAIAIVVVADRAIKFMISKNVIECLALCRPGTRRRGFHLGAVNGIDSAGSDELAVHLDHTGIAGLDGTKLGVIANLRNYDSAAVDGVYQAFPDIEFLGFAVHDDRQGSSPPLIDWWMLVRAACRRKDLISVDSRLSC